MRRATSVRIEGVGAGLDVREHHLRAGQRHRLGRRNGGVRRHDHLVTGANAKRVQYRVQAARGVGDADTRRHAERRRELSLERAHRLAADEIAGVEHRARRLAQRWQQRCVLSAQVDQRDGGVRHRVLPGGETQAPP
jgi:hypothetical protein